MDLLKEKKLVEKAQKDPAAFGQLFDRYYAPILNYVARRTGDIELAQDITSDTFFKAFRKLQVFQWCNVPFSAWLYRIATNEINSYFRKKKNKVVSLDRLREEYQYEPSKEGDPHSELLQAQEKMERHGDFLKISRLINELPMKYRAVVTLRFFEKKKTREIADILLKNENTIKSLLKRGVEKLEMLYRTSYPEDENG